MGWLTDALNRWDRVLHAPGEIVPASKLVTLQDTLRNTQLGLVHDLYARTAVSSNSGGVVHGLNPTADGAVARRLNIAAGSAFAIPEALGVIDTVQPIVLDFAGASQVLDVGDAVNPRYDLISVRAIQADTDTQAKLVKQADGSYIVTNLAQRQDWGCEVVYHAGTPGAVPVVDPLPASEVAIAVVFVPALFNAPLVAWDGVTPVVAGSIADCRTWLVPRSGGTRSYAGIITSGGAGLHPTAVSDYVDDPTLVLYNDPGSGLHWARGTSAGNPFYYATIHTPRELSVVDVALSVQLERNSLVSASTSFLASARTPNNVAVFGGALRSRGISFAVWTEAGVIQELEVDIRAHVRAEVMLG